MRVQIKVTDKKYLPVYAKPGDAGADLRARLNAEIVVAPGQHVIVPTGCFVAIPEAHEWQIRPRSGLAAKYQITVLNTPGTIDSKFRGEVKVIIINHGKDAFIIRDCDRIAQAVLTPYETADWDIVEELDVTERGAGCFGHTGKN